MAEERNKVRQEDTTSKESEMSEREVDENLEESFPASDPPSWTLGTDHREEEDEKKKSS